MKNTSKCLESDIKSCNLNRKFSVIFGKFDIFNNFIISGIYDANSKQFNLSKIETNLFDVKRIIQKDVYFSNKKIQGKLVNFLRKVKSEELSNYSFFYTDEFQKIFSDIYFYIPESRIFDTYEDALKHRNIILQTVLIENIEKISKISQIREYSGLLAGKPNEFIDTFCEAFYSMSKFTSAEDFKSFLKEK